jgi:hypothetical protein
LYPGLSREWRILRLRTVQELLCFVPRHRPGCAVSQLWPAPLAELLDVDSF